MAQKGAIFEFLLNQQRVATGALAGGYAYFYEVGGTTPKTIWLDRDKITTAANPYQLDANGTAQLYGDGIYRIVIKDSAGVTRYDRDNMRFSDVITSGAELNADDYASLAAAVAAIGSTVATLVISSPQSVTDNLSAPSTLSIRTLNTGIITISSGKTLTINSPFSAGNYQVFAGSGSVSFNSIKEVSPEWWGITGTADQIAINKAILSLSLGGTVRLLPKLYTVTDTITVKSYTQLIGEYGEDDTFGVQGPPKIGTEIKWAGGTTGNIITAFNTRLFRLDGIHLDGDGKNVTGILLDSDNTPSGSQNEFHRFSIRKCLIGVQWGTSGIAGGAYANDGTRFSTFTIWSQVTGSKGFVINSGNAGQMSTIESGGIQVESIGIDIVIANILQIRRVFGGGVMATAFIRSSVGIDLTIEGCSSEAWGTGKTWRTNGTYFLKVIAPAETYSVIEAAITMIGNQINNPILVEYPVRIVSTGDSWGYCKDFTTSADITAIGTFTDASSTGRKSRVLALNNGVNPVSVDLTTSLPAHGWIDGAYVNLTNYSPGFGWIAPAFDAANFSASGSMTWTLANVDVETYAYTLVDRTMTVSFKITTSTIGGTVSDTLKIKIPGSKTTSKTMVSTCRIINGTAVIGYCYVDNADTWIQIKKVDGSNFALGSDNVSVQGQLSFEVN